MGKGKGPNSGWLMSQAEKYGIDLGEYEFGGRRPGEMGPDLKSPRELESAVVRAMANDDSITRAIGYANDAGYDKAPSGRITDANSAYDAWHFMKKTYQSHDNGLGRGGMYTHDGSGPDGDAGMGDNYDVMEYWKDRASNMSTPDPEPEKEKKEKEDKSDPVPRPFTPEQITEAGEQLDSHFADGKNPYGMPDPRELYENSFTTAKNMGQEWDANFYVRELANGLNNQTTDYMNYLNDKNEYNTLRNGQEQLDYLERLGEMGVKIPEYKNPMDYVDDFQDMMDEFT